MNKFSMKYKYKVGEEVILKDHPHPGWSTVTKVESITIEIYLHWWKVLYRLSNGKQVHEDSLESLEEYNKRQRKIRMDYKHYVEWLNKQDFTK